MNAPYIIPQLIPAQGSTLTRAEEKVRKAQFRDLLFTILSEKGPHHATDLAKMTGSRVSTIREYLHEMRAEGFVACERIKGKGRAYGGTVVVMFRVSDGEDTSDFPGDVAKQATRKTYPLHHVRDDLVSALFGAPQTT